MQGLFQNSEGWALDGTDERLASAEKAKYYQIRVSASDAWQREGERMLRACKREKIGEVVDTKRGRSEEEKLHGIEREGGGRESLNSKRCVQAGS